jgi:hypothetical protein
MSKFAIFNMTDGIPSGGGQEFDSIESAEEWIKGERKKFMDIQGFYKTSDCVKMNPNDVVYEVHPVGYPYTNLTDEELASREEPDTDTPNGVHHTTELSAYGTTLKSRVRIVVIDRDGMPITALADRIEEETDGTTVITGAVCDAESIAQECMENMFQGVQFKIGHDANGEFLKEWNGRGLMWNEFREWVTGYIKIARIRTRKDTNE